jgi:phospholipase C
MQRLTRRKALQLLGASAAVAHCGPTDFGETADAITKGDKDVLDAIHHFVIVMMENRSFDHYLGALQRDKDYAKRDVIEGTAGNEWNPGPNGRVHVHHAKSYTLDSPPHGWGSCHRQWDHGNNDGFVTEDEGNNPNNPGLVMSCYERSDIPFYYFLADHFTVCDHWHASVMGPTTPNRLYLNCGTSSGSKVDGPVPSPEPRTIWEELAAHGISAKSYIAGKSGIMMHALPKKSKTIPYAPYDDFVTACKSGTLPSVSYIEPHYHKNSDHPNDDIRLGQTFVTGIYNQLRQSPQWDQSLLVVLYDEHGGFYDHVAPPTAEDEDSDFQRYGFRVPAFIAGPFVRKGHVASHVYDHTSILATLKARYPSIGDLSKRSKNARTIVAALDPSLIGHPRSGPTPPKPVIEADIIEAPGEVTQHELDDAIRSGVIPQSMLDPRSDDELVRAWITSLESSDSVDILR